MGSPRVTPVRNPWKRREPASHPVPIQWHQVDMVRRSLVRRWCALSRWILARMNACSPSVRLQRGSV